MALYGRESEQARLVGLVEAARHGRSGTLVLVGHPGVGKSVLLRDLVDATGADVQVLRTAGVQSESPVAFAALFRLLRPVLRLERLPAPQARALGVAFGYQDGDPVDPFMVGVATLTVLTEAAADGPVLSIVDDAQWLDGASAQAMLFAARQLGADHVAILFAARDETESPGEQAFRPDSIPVLQLGGLDETNALRLLSASSSASSATTLPDEVAHWLVRETGGNPLALIELPALLLDQPGDVTQAQVPLPVRLERAFLELCHEAGPQVRVLVLVTAVDSSGRAHVIRNAALQRGVDAVGWEDAERAGLLTVTQEGVTVRHPLLRSAVLQAATAEELRGAHAALAGVLAGDPDRRTWHLAGAAEGPDAQIAAALADVGERAERRGAHAAAVAAFARAAALSEESEYRAARMFRAARNAWASGRPEAARAWCTSARGLTGDLLLRADVDRLRGRVEVNVGSAPTAHRIFTQAAAATLGEDPARALEMASAAAIMRAHGADSGTRVDIGPFLSVRPSAERLRCLQLLLAAMTRAEQGSWGDALVTLSEAEVVARTVDDLDLWGNVANAALALGDDGAAHEFYTRMLVGARSGGAGMWVLYALPRLAFAQFASGHWTALRSGAHETVALARGVGQPALAAASIAWLAVLAGHQGDEAGRHYLHEAETMLTGHRLGILTDPVIDLVRWAKGMRDKRNGDSAGTLHHLGGIRHPVVKRLASLDRIEAAVRAGARDVATRWVDDLGPFATAAGQAWALAAVAYGRAMAGEDAAGGALLASALERHRDAGRPYERARIHLALGERLRRGNRRIEARTHLRAALETFTDLGAAPMLDRAADELRASGETARKRDPSTVRDLTPMELKVAQLVGSGLSNKDVAEQCWVSPRTVAFHLRNVFAKLGISSRGELARLDLD